MRYYLDVGPEAFLEAKGTMGLSPKPKLLQPQQGGGKRGRGRPRKEEGGAEKTSVDKKVPTPGAPEMKLVDPWKTAFLLVNHSNLTTLRHFSRVGQSYLYDNELGYYISFDKRELLVILSRILSLTGLIGLQKASYLKEVSENLFTLPQCSELGVPEFDNDIKVFTNGSFNLRTKVFGVWSPEYFVTNGLSFKYDPEAKGERFQSFLDDICEGCEDRKGFLKAWAWAQMNAITEFQIFLHVYGPGATGKSIWGLLMTALVGKAGTITTTLKGLQGDNFEITNLIGKGLR